MNVTKGSAASMTSRREFCRLLCAVGAAAPVFLQASGEGAEMKTETADVCVIGAGSAGIGTALAAARAGVDVILIERQHRLGGTAVNAYVCNWEPGPAGPFTKEIYDVLRRRKAVAITRDHNPRRKLGPFGLWLPDSHARWEDTLRRSNRPVARWRAVTFLPEIFADTAEAMLKSAGRCRIRCGWEFVKAETEPDGRVRRVRVRCEDGESIRIVAHIFVDCTGNAALCRDIECEMMLGAEARSRFGEPSAPESPSPRDLNAVSLCYRVTGAGKTESTVRVSDDPGGKAGTGWQRVAHVHAAGPDGDWIVNPLALLPGWMFVELGPEAARKQAEGRALAHWRWLRQFEPFRERRLHSLAPMLGIRESWRVMTRYVLTEHDVRGGLTLQKHDDLIAFADHALDVHGAGSRRVHGELREPYGVPFRCLLPLGRPNVMVAGRCAGFSHVAASSCRLSRTMLALGRAAGTAAALAIRAKCDPPDIDPAILRRRLFG